MGRSKAEMIGRRFGKWLVLDESEQRTKAGNMMYVCQCDCGTISNVSGAHMRMGLSRGCKYCTVNPAAFKKGMVAHNMMPSGIAQRNILIGRYRKRANKRGLDYNLTVEQFEEITQSDCFYCGKAPEQIVLNRDITNGKYVYNGIDRIDNTKGYTVENCVPCCKNCNRAKDIMSHKEFISHIEAIYNRQVKHGLEMAKEGRKHDAT